jgi:O-antigen ligase
MAGIVTDRPRAGAPSAPAKGVAGSVREQARGLAPSLFYLFIEFARPQAWVAPLGSLKPGMIAAAWGLGAVLFKRVRPIPAPMWAMLAFAGVMIWNVPFAINNAWALWGAQDFAILIVGCVLPLVLLPANLAAVRFLLSAYVFLHVPMAVHGLLFKGMGQGGWVADENDLALALNAALGVAVYLFMASDSKAKRWLLAGSMVAFVSAIVVTMSRGGFVGLACLALFLLMTGPRRGTMLTVLLLAVAALYLFAPASYWKEVASIEDSDRKGDTGEQRLYFWKLAWRMYLDHPLTGVGTRNYGINAPFYEDEERVRRGFHTWGRVCHSMHFTLIAEEGTIGILILFYLLWGCFRCQRRLRHEYLDRVDDPERREMMFLGTGLAAGLFGFLVCSTFLTSLYYPVFWVLVALFAVLDSVAHPPTPKKKPQPRIRR